MGNIKLLWLDDNSPKEVNDYQGFEIFTAQTCEDAERLLESKQKIDWAIIDLIVPQGKWGDSGVTIPGLHFINYLNERNKKQNERVGILAYSIILTEKTEKEIKAAGAVAGFAKVAKSFGGIIEDLRSGKIIH